MNIIGISEDINIFVRIISNIITIYIKKISINNRLYFIKIIKK